MTSMAFSLIKSSNRQLYCRLWTHMILGELFQIMNGGQWRHLKYVVIFTPNLGDMIQFDDIIFLNWVPQPPTW